MLVYRALQEPVPLFADDKSLKFGILCKFLDENDEDTKDYIIVDTEEIAWKLYHDIQGKWEPLVIKDES